MPAVKFNIGPGAIAQPSEKMLKLSSRRDLSSTEKNKLSFALSDDEWYKIQTYVYDASILPTTLDKFREMTKAKNETDLSDFQKLVDAYATIKEHVEDWEKNIFPETTVLASDIYTYSQKAPIYYAPIYDLAKKLDANPNDGEAKKKLLAILDSLKKEAKLYADRAGNVKNKIVKFADNTKNDGEKLVGFDGNGGLKKEYSDKCGSTSESAKRVAQEISSLKKALDSANSNYTTYLALAASSPAYLIIPFYGVVITPIIGGVFGGMTAQMKSEINSIEKQLKELKSQEAFFILSESILNTAVSSITEIHKSLSPALTAIQKIQGVWSAIVDDLTAIITTIELNIEDALPIIMDLGVDSAIEQWKNVGAAADNYRKNAYVTKQVQAA